jgi:hypothetical protein
MEGGHGGFKETLKPLQGSRFAVQGSADGGPGVRFQCSGFSLPIMTPDTRNLNNCNEVICVQTEKATQKLS